MPSSPRNPEARSPSLSLVIPDDVDVAILGCQVQGTGAIGVGSVPWPGLQQGRAHVAAQQQLDHLKGGVRVGRTWLGATPDHTQGKEDRQESCLAPQGDLPRRGRTHRPGPGASSPSCPPCTGWTGAAAASQTAGPGHGQSWVSPVSSTLPATPTRPHHVVVTMLSCEVQRNVTLIRWNVHCRAGLQHQLHGLLPALPGCIVQGSHSWGQVGTVGANP
jgi:hypothetical protein